ncbi:hypothetical protein PG990_002734 [Apiospora arundinis]
MLPRSLFRAAALQGRQQPLLSPSRARAALFAAAKTQAVTFSSSSQRGDADGQDGGTPGPRSYKAGWGRLIKMMHDLVGYLGFATASMELPKDLRVLGGVHRLNRLDKLRPPVDAKAKKSVHHLIRLCRKQLAEHVEKTKLIEDNISETGGFANGTAYEAIDLTVEIIGRDRLIDRLRRFLDHFPQSFDDEGSKWFKNRLRLRSSISE